MSETIRVSGFRRPRVTRPPRRIIRRVLPIRLMNLLWVVPIIVVPALPSLPGLPGLPSLSGLLGLPDLSGSPHLLLFSTSTGEGPFKYYTECAYVGLDGSITHTRGSSCPTVRFLKSTGGY